MFVTTQADYPMNHDQPGEAVPGAAARTIEKHRRRFRHGELAVHMSRLDAHVCCSAPRSGTLAGKTPAFSRLGSTLRRAKSIVTRTLVATAILSVFIGPANAQHLRWANQYGYGDTVHA
jgi:hypothetical protein